VQSHRADQGQQREQQSRAYRFCRAHAPLGSSIGGFGTRERFDEGILGIIAIDVHSVSDLAYLIALETAGRGPSFSG